ncbi:MAG TPA: isomerase [Gammaproteobacteria bacterium]|nr:isomerase [Gammaproteobacteria bacterium]
MMLKRSYIKPTIVFNLIFIVLATSITANATNVENNDPSKQPEQTLALLSNIEILKSEFSKNVLEVQNNLEKQIELLQDNFEKSSRRIKSQLIYPEEQRYKLEERHFSKIQHYTFKRDIQPILNKKCLACHACYDAPCQLKMEKGSGLERGASKIKVYNGSRLSNLSPTRLDIDYQTTEEWRQHGFYPVINGYTKQNIQSASLMLKMLQLGQSNPFPANKAIPQEFELGLTRQNSCAAPDEFEQYAETNPHGGMPLAVSGLTKKEYHILSTWLNEGAKISPDSFSLEPEQLDQINRWESWLNREDKRTQLVARYLYEHLFLAHLYFDQKNTPPNSNGKPLFFKLIRSFTPPGELPIPVNTTRPNDAANATFYYRLQPITDTLVNKTHIAYRFDEQRLKALQQLFFSTDWEVIQLPGYNEAERGNPFVTFSAIPAKIRYQFLLNDAAFFVRNFIRGPVCRGQIATDVIRDQFWIMFEDPEYERYVNDELYQLTVNPLLGVPGQNVSLIDFGSEWLIYHDKRNKYLNMRQRQYNNNYPSGAKLSHIWDGDQHNQSAFQTIFRHHDSASIIPGWHGGIPKTTWLLDYPLFERTFYELVVGFNVFGNVSHQVQTRLYFDLIRNEGETNFLRFMPAPSRNSIYQQWYAGSGQIVTFINYHELDTKTASAVKFKTNKPYTELLGRLMAQYPRLTQATDNINRCTKHCTQQKNNSITERINHALRLIAAKRASLILGIKWLPDVSFLRINLPDGDYRVYSLIRNRMHTNVAFMLGESLRLQESLDTLTITPTLVGSYPNLMLQVDLSELEKFTSLIALANSEINFERIINHWGVRRMSPDFWNVFHSFSQYMSQHTPLEAGIYDLNRYGHF